jgi:catechol 2,3-dioxygenase-like lactoylglutathione lyase family enzyme
MAGIIFFKTSSLEQITRFYTKRMGMKVWLDQGGCTIFRSGNLLLGFCRAGNAESEGVITYFYKTREEVDERYSALSDIAGEQPRENQQYRIYQFFAEDPEGRTLEFQSFLHPVDFDFGG